MILINITAEQFYEDLENKEWFDVLDLFVVNKYEITDSMPIRIFDKENYEDDFSGNDIEWIADGLLRDVAKYLTLCEELGDFCYIQNGDFITIATPEFCRVKSLENGHKIGKSFLEYVKRNM